MSKISKRIFSIAATAALLCALALPAAAHGGRHGGRHNAPAATYCGVCEQYHTVGACRSGTHHSGSHCRA